MPQYNHYRFTAAGAAAGKWTNLAPQLTLVDPGPGAPAVDWPWAEASKTSGLTPSEFWWLGQTFGYGEPATCYAMWHIGGFGLGAAQRNSLRRMARTRALMLHRLIVEIPPPPPVGPLQLQLRDIEPLVEKSDKTGTSYLLGCAMAMKFAPLAIQFSTGVLPGRLYHASLLKSHALGGMALTWVPATSEPDFVAFDFLGRVHLIESKGNMGALDYGGLGKGINQVRNLNNFVVGGVNVFPTTRTACATYTKRCAALVGTCGREVRGCVVEVPCAHAGGQNVVPPDHPLRRRLAGLYALGAFASLDALSNQEPEDAGPWQIYSVPPVPDLVH